MIRLRAAGPALVRLGPPSSSSAPRRTVPALLLALALAAATLALFWPVVHQGYFTYDDDLYVAANPVVQRGLTWAGARWAFESVGYAANWHPLTWLSLMLDADLLGPGPRGPHLMNAALHAAAAGGLLVLLRSLTGALWPAAFAAAAFALHPLRVESVAWIAERKDVLSGCFLVLTLAAWLRFTRRPGPGRYLAALGVFALGLLAKPMLVTLPFLLLLLDFWPLGRWRLPHGPGRARTTGASALLLEKIPFLLLAAGASALTALAQQRGGLVMSGERIPFMYRAANALVSCARYLGKILWPRGLEFFYPHPGAELPLWQAVAAGALLLALSVAALATARRRPAAAVGWFWFLGTLVPVIGFVQVGWQGMADRYTYVPGIGLLLCLWAFLPGVPGAARGSVLLRRLLAGAALAVLAALALATRVQLGYWREPAALFARSLQVDAANWVARYELGTILLQQGRPGEALPYLEAALALRPDLADGGLNRAAALAALGRTQEAERRYRELLGRHPDLSAAWFNLGNLLAADNRLEEAEAAYREGRRTAPRP